MTTHHIRTAFGAVLALALLAPPALRAQEIPSPYRFIEDGMEASVFTGWFDAATGRFELGPQPAALFGARWGIEVSGPLAFEVAASYLPTTRNIVNPALGEGDRIIDEADAALAFVDAALRFAFTGRRTWNRINPYALIGGGVIFDVAGGQQEDQKLEEDDTFSFGTGFNGIFGGGARIFVTDRIAVRTDATLNLYKVDIPNGFRDPERGFENVPEDEWVSTPRFTVGLAWLF